MDQMEELENDKSSQNKGRGKEEKKEDPVEIFEHRDKVTGELITRLLMQKREKITVLRDEQVLKDLAKINEMKIAFKSINDLEGFCEKLNQRNNGTNL